MTRLTTNDIDGICSQLVHYDRHLKTITGRSLLGIGTLASGFDDEDRLRRLAPGIRMTAVSINSGLGVISGFAEIVCGILDHLGFDARVGAHADVAGIAEAVDTGAQVIMASDDDRFAAICPRMGRTVDNARATAWGFVTGLDLMAGGLEGRDVLVLGCGPVGRGAVEALLTRKANVSVVDCVANKAAALARTAQRAFRVPIRVAADADKALAAHQLIVDATNTADVIHARHVTGATRIAAPGMPCGITPRAREKLIGRYIHDPLQIGVAAMACLATRLICGENLGTVTGAMEDEN